MNYDQYIYQIIEALKADKSIPAEYRNAVISSGRRWQLEIRGAKTMARSEAPQSMFQEKTAGDTFLSSGSHLDSSAQATATQNGRCICPVGGRRRDCLVHEGMI